VQNTGIFTISDVFNIPQLPYDGSLSLLGNNAATSAEPGFDLLVDRNGNLEFDITDGTGNASSLISQNLATINTGNGSLPELSTGTWYQIVIVGNGPGEPLTYYLTPMSATAVQQYQTASSLAAIGMAVATGPNQNLQIGNVNDGFTLNGNPTLNFKDVALFNQALSPAAVDQLFLDEQSGG
jgi:hypothetical protein